MFEYFIVHSKKLQFVSWKTEAEVYLNGSKKKLLKTKAEFFKNLLPGDIIELSFECKSSNDKKNWMTCKAWRGDNYLGERKDTFNYIVGGLFYFNLKEID